MQTKNYNRSTKRSRIFPIVIGLALLILVIFAVSSSCIFNHEWIAATCSNPKTCSKCGETEGTSLSHKWKSATCETPMTCSVCGKTQGTVKKHLWTMETETTPKMCYACGKMEPMSLPYNGQVFIGKDKYCGSTLTIKSSTSEACYIKLKDKYKNDVFSFFVRAGATAEVPVPTGNYYVYFAYGKDWYGPEYVFGSETSYAKDDELLDFTQYTWTYTLYPTSGGNFSETPISEDEF